MEKTDRLSPTLKTTKQKVPDLTSKDKSNVLARSSIIPALTLFQFKPWIQAVQILGQHSGSLNNRTSIRLGNC